MDHETVKLVEELVRWKLWHGQELAQQGLVVDFFAGNDWPAQEGNRVGVKEGGGGAASAELTESSQLVSVPPETALASSRTLKGLETR